MKSLTFISLSLLSISSWAQKGVISNVDKENASFCKLNEVPLERNVSLGDKQPEYFFKPVPRQGPNDTRDDVSVIIDGHNYIMNMETGALNGIPGPYDGVPTPDGEFIVSPANGGHIQFYDRNGLNDNSQVNYDDASSGQQLDGVYHSLGILNSSKDADSKTVSYRAITDSITNDGKENTLQFKDYTFKISNSGEKKLLSHSGVPKLLCSNFATKTIKTPIIAKNGRMLSAYNEETGTSVIYDIQQDKQGNSICVLKKDLGFATTKMEFSPDGKKVVFGMNSLQTTPSEVDWYSEPPLDTHNMNVFVYDFKEDELKKISSQKKGNAYYPSFSNDGKLVVYMSQEITGEDKDLVKYAVKRVELDKATGMPMVDFSSAKNCNLTDPGTLNLLALGKLWESICSEVDESMNISGIGTIPMSLNKDNCQEMVGSYWKEYQSKVTPENFTLYADEGRKGGMKASDVNFYRDHILAISEQQMLIACQSLKPKQFNNVPDKGVVKMNEAAVGKNMVTPEASCIQCHAQGGSSGKYIPFDKPEEIGKWKRKMLMHVATGNMPRNMNLTVEERDQLLEWIYDLKD